MTEKYWLKDFLLLTIFFGVLFGTFLGSRPLSVPDEGRYAEIPREMLTTGDFVTPRVNYIKYFEKPPLFYWLQAGAIKLLGPNEWSVRFITAFMGLLGCLLTYFTARKLYGRLCGWLSSLILGTSMLYFAMAHFVTIDMTVSVLLAGCLFSFLLGTHEKTGRQRNFYFWGMYAFSALATLTKGLIGILFPGIIIFLWIFIFNEWRNIKNYCLPTGILLWLIITLPWHILAQWHNPEFFHFYIIEQHFVRYLTNYADRNQAFWYLPVTLLLGFFPWIAFLPQAIKQNLPTSWKSRATEKDAVFLMLWAIVIYIFFQCSHSQLPPYILPIFPPLAILTGRYLAISTLQPIRKGIMSGFIIIAILATIVMLLPFLALPFSTHRFPQFASDFSLRIFAISLTLLLATIIAIGLYWKNSLTKALSVFIAGLAISLIILASLFNHSLFAEKSTKPLAMVLKPILKPDEQIVSYHAYYQDLPFYTQRRIVIVAWGTSELEFGMAHQDMNGWFIDDKTFWQQWSGPKRMFMVLGKKDYNTLLKTPPGKLCLLGETSRNVVVTNQCSTSYQLD